jgi:HSP20 family protein
MTSQVNTLQNRVFAIRTSNGTHRREIHAAAQRVWNPPMDLVETARGYRLQIDLPGLGPDAIQLTFQDNTLRLEGSRGPAAGETADSAESVAAVTPPAADLPMRVYAMERWSGSFARAVHFPEHVDPESIEATFNEGVLTVIVPKAERALARRIRVGHGSAGRNVG